MYGRMDGWMDASGWMHPDGCIRMDASGWMDGWMDACMHACMYVCMVPCPVFPRAWAWGTIPFGGGGARDPESGLIYT